MEWPSVSSDSGGHHRAATATQELRRSQADREQAEALTGSFGWNLSSQEFVCSDVTFSNS